MKARTHAENKILISNLIIIGDSLSDRGTVYERKLLGFIPMRLLTGLQGKSPDGSFTNGYTWSDDFIAALASEFTIEKIKREKHLHSDDIADAIVNEDVWIKSAVRHYYNLKNSHSVDFLGQTFVRDYTEGGLSAHDYAWVPSASISRFFTRLILSNLKAKRGELFTYDYEHDVSKEYKEKTLVIEWSGANDLITVNARPSKSEVNLAVKERIKNVKKLMEHGYCHFILFNLPNLSLTPRFYELSEKERQHASKLCHYFNEKLAASCKKLRKKNKNCTIKVFDIEDKFQRLYDNPEKYNLDRSKLHIPYTESKDFKMLKNGTSPSTGSMFWDKVHPTADVHAILAAMFFEEFRNTYYFSMPGSPEKERVYHNEEFTTDKFGLFSHSSDEQEDSKRIVAKPLRHSC